jgi:hypothetical protein
VSTAIAIFDEGGKQQHLIERIGSYNAMRLWRCLLLDQQFPDLNIRARLDRLEGISLPTLKKIMEKLKEDKNVKPIVKKLFS